MNILNEITSEVSAVFKKYSIEEKAELRISGYENYDYQINALVRHQSLSSIDLLLKDPPFFFKVKKKYLFLFCFYCLFV